MVRQLELPAKISRNAPPPTLLPFVRFFQGFEKVPTVKKIFGKDTNKVIRKLKVEFCTFRFGYMAVSHKDAHIVISRWHLKNSDLRTIYLDLIHELFHVGQFMHERESFIKGYERLVRAPEVYFKNPIEIAAYKFTVEEARRIGLNSKEIEEYLSVPWAAQSEFRTFLNKVGLARSEDNTASPVQKIPVRISRRAPLAFYRFTDYFRGFESVPAIRKIFGKKTQDVLNGLRVEFSSHPLNYLQMAQDDGHLEVSLWHLSDSDISVLYLDVFLYLQFVHQFMQGRWDTNEFAFLFAFSDFKFDDPEFAEYVAKASGFANFAELEAAKKLPSLGLADVPIAIEAYRATIEEGRRIGMSEEELAEYVYAPAGPMTPEAHARFLRNLGIKDVMKRAQSEG